MKKILSFLFVALPLGVVLSVLLSTILAGVTFCRSFADYWAYIVVQFFPMYGQKDPEEHEETEEKQKDIWENHIARMEARQQQEKDNTKSN